jgi:hypothetical protein
VKSSPRWRHSGSSFEDVRAHVQGRGFSTNFKYKVIGEYSNDGGLSWSTPFDVLAEQSSAGTLNGAAYNTRTNFGLLVRFRVGVVNAAGTVKETGTLSVSISALLYQ